jgi:hypothetical protein
MHGRLPGALAAAAAFWAVHFCAEPSRHAAVESLGVLMARCHWCCATPLFAERLQDAADVPAALQRVFACAERSRGAAVACLAAVVPCRLCVAAMHSVELLPDGAYVNWSSELLQVHLLAPLFAAADSQGELPSLEFTSSA